MSLSTEVLHLLDQHADGRSRSRAIEEELMRALRAREWERLAAQTTPADTDEQEAWAEYSLRAVDEALTRDERPMKRSKAVRRRRS